eukprot:GHVO01036188.1.p2 GENE.GHVO01036188.1~~GHVO01036188.1.p2  ORF type:complete len:129 (-),score=10.08 GHVO01036188.1:265-651(-)
MTPLPLRQLSKTSVSVQNKTGLKTPPCSTLFVHKKESDVFHSKGQLLPDAGTYMFIISLHARGQRPLLVKSRNDLMKSTRSNALVASRSITCTGKPSVRIVVRNFLQGKGAYALCRRVFLFEPKLEVR